MFSKLGHVATSGDPTSSVLLFYKRRREMSGKKVKGILMVVMVTALMIASQAVALAGPCSSTGGGC